MEQKYDINLDTIKHLLLEDAASEGCLNEQGIQDQEMALIQFAQAHAIEPPSSIKKQILEKIRELNAHKNNPESYDLNNLPLLTADANWLVWRETVKNIQSPEEYDNIYLHTLESNDKRDLFLAYVKEMVPEEVHHDVLESFILIEGSCECHIINLDGSQRVVNMSVGDFIDFKLGEIHDIYITSSTPAIAILQWVKVAA